MKVQSPVEGFTGVVAGVAFTGGEGECDRSDASAIRYFRRHGYRIERADTAEAETEPQPKKSRSRSKRKEA